MASVASQGKTITNGIKVMAPRISEKSEHDTVKPLSAHGGETGGEETPYHGGLGYSFGKLHDQHTDLGT